MAKGNFDKAQAELLKHEGGYVNHPRDPGGITNLGVTKRTYEEWVGFPVTAAIMRGLTPAKVRTLYKTRYWDAVGGDDLPAGADLMVYDFAVNAGPARARKYLQKVVGVAQDGIIGPNTKRALQQFLTAHGAVGFIRAYALARLGYYHHLKTFNTFGRGWTRRVHEVEAAALKMAGHA